MPYLLDRTVSKPYVQLPEDDSSFNDQLSIASWDNLDFVTFRCAFIHPFKRNDDKTNSAVESSSTWSGLNDKERLQLLEDVYFFDRLKPYPLLVRVPVGETFATRLLQHPILQISKGARVDLLERFYAENAFIAELDLGMGEYDESELTLGLRLLPRQLRVQLFRSSMTSKQPSLTIAFKNFNNITISGILEWVNLTLNGMMSSSKLNPVAIGFTVDPSNWSFAADNTLTLSEDSKMMELLLRELQVLAVDLGKQTVRGRGNINKVVINWLSDYDMDGNVDDNTDTIRQAKLRLGQISGHRFKRIMS